MVSAKDGLSNSSPRCESAEKVIMDSMMIASSSDWKYLCTRHYDEAPPGAFHLKFNKDLSFWEGHACSIVEVPQARDRTR